ncbi:MAG: Asp-tRNA(Asn)/Glu-tRNA(Gln) amidotransferase GatCAB subunit B, partial [Acidilobaceae archaeon]
MRARIGLEIHVQVTEAGTKLFCGCSADYRGRPPNSNVCPVCLGLPGALPVVNKRVVELALRTAIALNCRIPDRIVFTRKHYFYPDLPK